MVAPSARLASEGLDEAGETLLEVLISAALMAIVVLAIVGGIGTMLFGSKLHRDQTDGNTALVAAMEQLKSPETPRSCSGYTGLPAGVTVKKIEYQTGVALVGGVQTVQWSETAPCSLTSLLSLQRITLGYANTSSSVAPSLSFVKGDQ